MHFALATPPHPQTFLGKEFARNGAVGFSSKSPRATPNFITASPCFFGKPRGCVFLYPNSARNGQKIKKRPKGLHKCLFSRLFCNSKKREELERRRSVRRKVAPFLFVSCIHNLTKREVLANRKGKNAKRALLFSFFKTTRHRVCGGAASSLRNEEEKMRGCEKRMVFLRHADSELFEEAYFVMRRDARRPDYRDMVAEAERILRCETGEKESHTARFPQKCGKRKRGRGKLSFLFAFALGVLLSGALFFFLF